MLRPAPAWDQHGRQCSLTRMRSHDWSGTARDTTNPAPAAQGARPSLQFSLMLVTAHKKTGVSGTNRNVRGCSAVGRRLLVFQRCIPGGNAAGRRLPCNLGRQPGIGRAVLQTSTSYLARSRSAARQGALERIPLRPNRAQCQNKTARHALARSRIHRTTSQAVFRPSKTSWCPWPPQLKSPTFT